VIYCLLKTITDLVNTQLILVFFPGREKDITIGIYFVNKNGMIEPLRKRVQRNVAFVYA